MEFSVAVAFWTFAFVVVEGMVSWVEGNFFRKQKTRPVRLTFIWHWGVVVGDLVLLAIFNGLIMPYVLAPMTVMFPLVAISLSLTCLCHKAWWPREEKSLNFMVPNWDASNRVSKFWYRDMTAAGWMHFVFMTVQLVIIGLYLYSPMPSQVVRTVAVIFFVFVPVAIIEPGVVEGWPLSKPKIIATAGMAIVLWVIVGLATWVKL